jgi:NADP-dependent 3-hydroxy acid dehydrogenase YdfG
MRALRVHGHIVNISSTAALAEPTQVYGATKWAVNGISRMLRKELENDTIPVVNIRPGATVTNFARNFPPDFVQGIAAMVGIKADFKPGAHLPPEIPEQVVAAAKPILAGPDDVASAVLYALSQPIELNVFEMVVRPQKQLSLA